MLYGVAREMVRDLTGRGPYSDFILPSTSFYEPEPEKTRAAKKVAPKRNLATKNETNTVGSRPQ
jgi:hypothetical protein